MGQSSNGEGEVEARTCCIELGLFGKERCCDFWKDAVHSDVKGASFFRSFLALLRRTTVTKSIQTSLAHEDSASNGRSEFSVGFGCCMCGRVLYSCSKKCEHEYRKARASTGARPRPCSGRFCFLSQGYQSNPSTGALASSEPRQTAQAQTVL
jgi:hypothetical protein